MHDDDQTLEQIEQDYWPEPPSDATFLVRRVTALRRVPLAELGVEDLRIMIGQGVGLPVLVPRALAVLEREPLAEGDFYPGDLLSAVARKHDQWNDAVVDGLASLRRIALAVDPDDPEVDDELMADLARFRT